MSVHTSPTVSRRSLVLGILGAVPLSLLPTILRSDPAYADTLSGVFHGPTGNDDALNRDIWYSVKGFTTPYPGDSKVVLPSQVPPAATDD